MKEMDSFSHIKPAPGNTHEMNFEYTLGYGTITTSDNTLCSRLMDILSRYTNVIRRTEFGITFEGNIPYGFLRTAISYYEIPVIYYRNSAEGFVTLKLSVDTYPSLYFMHEESTVSIIWNIIRRHEPSVGHWKLADYKSIIHPIMLKNL